MTASLLHGYRRVSFSSEGIQRVDEKIDDSLHTATTMTLSPDGKWMWDGSNWIPAPPQEAIKEFSESPVVEAQPESMAVLPAGMPPTTVSTNPLAMDDNTTIVGASLRRPTLSEFIQLTGLVLVILPILFFIFSTIFWGYGDTEKMPLFFVGVIVLAIGWFVGWRGLRLIRAAEIEFASGNIEKAMKYYKIVGDIEKLRECSELLEQQQPHQITSSQKSEIYSQQEVISMSDSVVSGDVHYHLNQPQAAGAVHSDEPQVSTLMKIGRGFAFFITLLAAVLKIGDEIMN